MDITPKSFFANISFCIFLDIINAIIIIFARVYFKDILKDGFSVFLELFIIHSI